MSKPEPSGNEVSQSPREAELEKQVAELKKELDDMTYAVSHDLRAPLRAVLGFSDALREDFADKLDPEAIRYISIISGSTRQMSRMIEGILTLSRIGRAKVQLDRIPTRSLVDGIIVELQSRHPERKLEFKVADLPDAHGDHSLIRQVWAHLLQNAVKFTANASTAQIEITGERTPNETIFSVKDNGAGFDMKYQPKLFGLFQRFHTENEFEGTGVGLAVVRRIIIRHGGRLWADSAVNIGSTFSFALPNP